MSFPLSGAPHSRWFSGSGLQARGPAVFWAAVRLACNGPGCMRPLAAANAAVVIPGRAGGASPESLTTARDMDSALPRYRSGPGMTERHKRVEAGLVDPDVGGLDDRCPADNLGINGGAKFGR